MDSGAWCRVGELQSWKSVYNFQLPKNWTTKSLMLTRSLTNITVNWNIFCVYMICIIFMIIPIIFLNFSEFLGYWVPLQIFPSCHKSPKYFFQYIYWKKFTYKWTHTIQTYVVHRSPVKHKMKKSWKIQFGGKKGIQLLELNEHFLYAQFYPLSVKTAWSLQICLGLEAVSLTFEFHPTEIVFWCFFHCTSTERETAPFLP